jgi:pimeloyl-ACP methyl ester carboxylesterase
MTGKQRATIDGITLEFELHGDGEPVVFVHHGAGLDWFKPLLENAALGRRFCLIGYHRPGYGASGPLQPPLTFEQETTYLCGLLRHLGFERTHVVGHSASACIALQMARDAPAQVHTLALLEAALMAVTSPPEVPRALELFRNGEVPRAVDMFLLGTCGPAHRAVLARMVPDAIDQAVASAATFFGHELPALRQWQFGAEQARQITQPVLAVLGEKSERRFQERHQLLRAWLPHVEPLVLPDAGHLLHLENPGGMASGLAAFLARHPITVAAGSA